MKNRILSVLFLCLGLVCSSSLWADDVYYNIPAPEQGPYAEINSIKVDHNVNVKGQKGMRIHVNLNAFDVMDHELLVCVYFYFEEGRALSGMPGTKFITNDGNATVQSSAIAKEENISWKDFTLFMPYVFLNMPMGKNSVNQEGRVSIFDKTAETWLTSDYGLFGFSFSY